jgi:ketosteroid isomerase-like protein
MPQRSTEVEAVVRDWLGAKQAGDAAAIRAVVSTYDDALAIGTEAEEWWAGSDAFTDADAGTAPFSAVTSSSTRTKRAPPGGQPCVRSSAGTAGRRPSG